MTSQAAEQTLPKPVTTTGSKPVLTVVPGAREDHSRLEGASVDGGASRVEAVLKTLKTRWPFAHSYLKASIQDGSIDVRMIKVTGGGRTEPDIGIEITTPKAGPLARWDSLVITKNGYVECRKGDTRLVLDIPVVNDARFGVVLGGFGIDQGIDIDRRGLDWDSRPGSELINSHMFRLTSPTDGNSRAIRLVRLENARIEGADLREYVPYFGGAKFVNCDFIDINARGAELKKREMDFDDGKGVRKVPGSDRPIILENCRVAGLDNWLGSLAVVCRGSTDMSSSANRWGRKLRVAFAADAANAKVGGDATRTHLSVDHLGDTPGTQGYIGQCLKLFEQGKTILTAWASAASRVLKPASGWLGQAIGLVSREARETLSAWSKWKKENGITFSFRDSLPWSWKRWQTQAEAAVLNLEETLKKDASTRFEGLVYKQGGGTKTVDFGAEAVTDVADVYARRKDLKVGHFVQALNGRHKATSGDSWYSHDTAKNQHTLDLGEGILVRFRPVLDTEGRETGRVACRIKIGDKILSFERRDGVEKTLATMSYETLSHVVRKLVEDSATKERPVDPEAAFRTINFTLPPEMDGRWKRVPLTAPRLAA